MICSSFASRSVWWWGRPATGGLRPRERGPCLRRGATSWLVLGVLAAVTLGAAGAVGAQPYGLYPAVATDKPLELGNGHKIAVGAGGSLHVVYVTEGVVKYATSLDGAAWTTLGPLSGAHASQPTIAVDAAGKVIVVWVTDGAWETGAGALHYAYRLPGSTTWNQVSLGQIGAEPAVITQGLQVHLTWVSPWPSRVLYATFPTESPGALAPEVVDLDTCSYAGFHRPSLTITTPPGVCPAANVNVAYLVTYGCGAVSTVGPRVRRRTGTSAWAELYSNPRGVLGSSHAATPVALSLSSHRATGTLFLAWSDRLATLDGPPERTVLAKGVDTTWTALTLAAEKRHVQVRAASSPVEPATLFRLAWTKAGTPDDPYFGAATTVDTATWTGAAPAWSSSTLLSSLGAGRPQAVFWHKCMAISSLTASVSAYFEAVPYTGTGRQLAISLTQSSGCAPVVPVLDTPCKSFAVLVASVGLTGQPTRGTLIDLEDVGVVTAIGASTATVTAPGGRQVSVSWRSGAVAASSPTSLTLTAPRADVTVASREVAIQLVELGHLAEYDAARVP